MSVASPASIEAPAAPRFDARALAGGAGRALAPIVVALLVGAVVLAVTGWDPVSVYRLMAREAFGSWAAWQGSLAAATPLLFCGLATAIAFRAGAFNVGVDGSFVLGGLVAAWLGAAVTGLPGIAVVLVCLVAAAVVGAAWSVPPALLRTRLGVDEVVSTLMLNYVALGLASWIVNSLLLARGSANSASKPIAARAELPTIGSAGTMTIGLLIALAAVVVFGVWSARSVRGFELKLSGLNPRFAVASGMPVLRIVGGAMVVSGLVGGLGGGVHALGVVHRFVDGFSPGYGFTGIAVALLARNGAWGLVPAAVLFGALASAGATVQLVSDIPLDIVDVLQGTITVLAAAQVAVLWRRRRRAS
jgi:general nucleoside transport system permease protein